MNHFLVRKKKLIWFNPPIQERRAALKAEKEEGGGSSEAGEGVAPRVWGTTGAFVLSRGLGTGEGRTFLAAFWEGPVVLITVFCVGG